MNNKMDYNYKQKRIITLKTFKLWQSYNILIFAIIIIHIFFEIATTKLISPMQFFFLLTHYQGNYQNNYAYNQ